MLSSQQINQDSQTKKAILSWIHVRFQEEIREIEEEQKRIVSEIQELKEYEQK